MKIACSMLLGCFALSSQIWAEGLSAEDQRLLARYDANGDRAISTSEVEMKRKQVFTRLDSNLDGQVSFDEYELVDQQKRLPLLKARFDTLDSNQDGQVTAEEYASYLGSFSRLDQNKDGQISGSEIGGVDDKADKSSKNQADLCLLWLCVRKSIN
ncbi:EF-hand domain-containing protein [Agaribacterium sp. ZY112]|uniref:EF-hand domain-containing protein n=1 Tax=Agaribacterium sp. ZY112 TaxID=3233574 RepID=UPI003523BF4B